jgi:hypothetical protein
MQDLITGVEITGSWGRIAIKEQSGKIGSAWEYGTSTDKFKLTSKPLRLNSTLSIVFTHMLRRTDSMEFILPIGCSAVTVFSMKKSAAVL